MRLTRPEAWAHEYALPYRRYRALDAATIVHGRITSLDPDVRRLTVARPDGTTLDESYDAWSSRPVSPTDSGGPLGSATRGRCPRNWPTIIGRSARRVR